SALSSASSRGDWRLLFIQRDRVAAVEAYDVNRVARTYFQKPNRTVGLYVPAKESQRLAVPAAGPIDAVVKDYQGGTALEAGEAFDPSPANLDARLIVVAEGGLKSGLLPKKNRGETVSLVITLHYGNSESLKGQATAAGMLPGVMMAGTKKHDRQALREELDALGIRIGTGGGGRRRGGRGGRGGGGGGAAGQLTFSVEAKRNTLPQALELLGEILREPEFPADEFETSKRRMTSMLTAGRTEPGALAGNKVSRALSRYSADDVRYVPTLEETLDRTQSVTLEDVRRLYESQVGGAHAELGVVGDFDPQTTLRLVEAILAGWESKVPFERIDRKAADDIVGFQEDIVTPDKSNAEYLAGMTFPLCDDDPDYAALRIGNFIFGGSTLASRLGDRIRQKDGLSYGATSSFVAPSRDPDASLTVTVSTNPENIEKVTAAVMEELRRFLKDGPTDKELSDAKQAFIEAQKVDRAGDGAIAAQIVANLDVGRTFAYAAEQEKAILALTPVEVAEAFRKYVDPKKLVVIRAGDFKK
ncbi:MAG TPA: insulinase family protein, partial [Pirellulales bacterium]|nr:insulinase family protein [Pirellulales bacterium]